MKIILKDEEYLKRNILAVFYKISRVAKNTFEYGTFLKHIDYVYEQETRIKLRINLEEQYNLMVLANMFYYDNWIIQE